MQQRYHYQQLTGLFNNCFVEKFSIHLAKSDNEPAYLLTDGDTPYHRIVFTHGFFISALREVSHQCVTGRACRERVDFGYWYCPGGHDAMTQSQSEEVGMRPQACERLFCVAAGFPFNVSCDSLEGDVEPDHITLQRRVRARVMTLPE